MIIMIPSNLNRGIEELWCDFIVVGAGTSSLGLAARLAEVDSWKVCVFERGPLEERMKGA
jgi:ribulose 1,5-bisphosphate synthetase/thiazole synthase